TGGRRPGFAAGLDREPGRRGVGPPRRHLPVRRASRRTVAAGTRPVTARGGTMNIWAVTPIHVDPEELARRQARYDARSPSGLRVELVDIGADAPRQLATEQDVRDSEGLVSGALNNAPERADALMPDCFLDPGVAELSGKLARPVFGLLRTSTTWSVLSGRRFGAVTRNAA